MLADKLKQSIKENKSSIYKLSKKSKIAYATLYDIVNGECKNPRLNTLIKIANAINKPLNELIEVNENEKSYSQNQKKEKGS